MQLACCFDNAVVRAEEQAFLRNNSKALQQLTNDGNCDRKALMVMYGWHNEGPNSWFAEVLYMNRLAGWLGANMVAPCITRVGMLRDPVDTSAHLAQQRKQVRNPEVVAKGFLHGALWESAYDNECDNYTRYWTPPENVCHVDFHEYVNERLIEERRVAWVDASSDTVHKKPFGYLPSLVRKPGYVNVWSLDKLPFRKVDAQVLINVLASNGISLLVVSSSLKKDEGNPGLRWGIHQSSDFPGAGKWHTASNMFGVPYAEAARNMYSSVSPNVLAAVTDVYAPYRDHPVVVVHWRVETMAKGTDTMACARKVQQTVSTKALRMAQKAFKHCIDPIRCSSELRQGAKELGDVKILLMTDVADLSRCHEPNGTIPNSSMPAGSFVTAGDGCPGWRSGMWLQQRKAARKAQTFLSETYGWRRVDESFGSYPTGTILGDNGNLAAFLVEGVIATKADVFVGCASNWGCSECSSGRRSTKKIWDVRSATNKQNLKWY